MKYELPNRIIELSVAKNWVEAKLEWTIYRISYSKEPETCLCGHFPINELNYIINKRNGKITLIGSCCILKFFDINIDKKIFQAIKKHKLNNALLQKAFELKFINSGELDFLSNTFRKHCLSYKQEQWLDSLKIRIFDKFKLKESQ